MEIGKQIRGVCLAVLIIVFGLGLKHVLKTAAKAESFDAPARVALKWVCTHFMGLIWGMIVGEFIADVAFHFVVQGKPKSAH